MKYLISRREPAGTRILLIESGSRALAEGLLPHLRSTWAAEYTIDLATCYGGMPEGFQPDGDIFRVTDYGSPERRKELIRELRRRDYAYLGVICSAEPIMTKWKWWIALRVPAKVFIVNENGDYFWLNRENAAVVREFALVRGGLAGAGAIRTFARLLVFPFTVLFLLMYAFTAHMRRSLNK
ncbi:MAG TPA: hypothetical protein VHB50_03570 [Bryobacteraceae bacterium]|nr:hypothetical protein [Bryobacteraceae bacterium]